MTADQIRYAIELGHRRQYEQALYFFGMMSPDWDELTGEQKAEVRAENKRYWQEMADFGRTLAAECA